MAIVAVLSARKPRPCKFYLPALRPCHPPSHCPAPTSTASIRKINEVPHKIRLASELKLAMSMSKEPGKRRMFANYT
eukprot:15377718-Alexandrium_andersonii.AAC.1